MTKAKLVILRHGQTEYNKQHLMTGQVDIPLTELGREQAQEAGKLLRGIRFDKAYSSNLSRAFNTAALALEAAAQTHLLNADGTWQIEQCKDIAEIDSGDFSGRSHKTDPEIVNWGWGYEVPLPGGESEKQVVERVKRFFDAEVMPRLLKGENVLVIAHAGVLRALEIALGVAEVPAKGLTGTKRRIPNAAPNIYEYEDGRIKSFSILLNPKDDLTPANENEKPPAPGKKSQGPKI